MINPKDHPIGWAMLLYELDDAHEHLGSLIKAISSDPKYSEECFRVDLGHVLAHLNRAWRRRLVQENMTDQELDDAREYPGDLRPIA
jgi:hypothetical protein